MRYVLAFANTRLTIFLLTGFEADLLCRVRLPSRGALPRCTWWTSWAASNFFSACNGKSAWHLDTQPPLCAYKRQTYDIWYHNLVHKTSLKNNQRWACSQIRAHFILKLTCSLCIGINLQYLHITGDILDMFVQWTKIAYPKTNNRLRLNWPWQQLFNCDYLCNVFGYKIRIILQNTCRRS